MSSRIHFGSLAESKQLLAAAAADESAENATDEKESQNRMEGITYEPSSPPSSLAHGKRRSLDVLRPTPLLECVGMTTIMTTADLPMSREQRELLEQLERKQEAKTLAVPTDDVRVRQLLRDLLEPVTLFGEGPYERRERLRMLLAQRGTERVPLYSDESADESEEEQIEEFYTEGSEELCDARRFLAEFSLPRTRHRLARQREENSVPFTTSKPVRKRIYQGLKTVNLYGTQIGGTRPLSSCSFAPDSQSLATGCFSGEMKLWSAPECRQIRNFRGHHARVDGISWHPQACRTHAPSELHLASGDADGRILLWNFEREEPIHELQGHTMRVTKTAFHPSGRFLGSASHDYSWRLWDLEAGGTELLLQEGHSRPVQSIDFQHDGALAVTGGLDGTGRVWDLRSGRSIMLLEGHVNAIPAVAFLPSSYEIATASSDHSVRIHDVRKLKSSVFMIPAHTNLVSDIRFHFQYSATSSLSSSDLPSLESYYGDFFVTAGFDGVAKIWGCGDWRLLKTLAGHEGKVMSVDISADGSMIATASYDRTFKIWAKEQESAEDYDASNASSMDMTA